VYGTRYNVHSMLKKTVYFRTQEDLDKFNALPNKAEWISERLNAKGSKLVGGLVEDTRTETERQTSKPITPYKPTHYKPTEDWGA